MIFLLRFKKYLFMINLKPVEAVETIPLKERVYELTIYKLSFINNYFFLFQKKNLKMEKPKLK